MKIKVSQKKIIQDTLFKLMPGNSLSNLFVLQLGDRWLKIGKFKLTGQEKGELIALDIQEAGAKDPDEIRQAIASSLGGMGYQNEPLAVCLSRLKVTWRNIKLPSQDKGEIAKIVSLQASRYLPYPSDELVTGFQVAAVDKNGYADINLIIAHKDTVTQALGMVEQLRPSQVIITLNSFGLAVVFSRLYPAEEAAVLIDLDAEGAEFAVVSRGKLIFSRYFKIEKNDPAWKGLFSAEVQKSCNAFTRETSLAVPEKFFLLSILGGLPKEAKDGIVGEGKRSLEEIVYSKLGIADRFIQALTEKESSLSGIVGLGLELPEASLNLLPPDKKVQEQKIRQRSQGLRLAGYILAIVLLFCLGAAKNLDNKARYLVKLKEELAKVSAQARPLEEIERRARFVASGLRQKPTALDVIYELHQIMPDEIKLANLSYEEAKEIILRGQSSALEPVFKLVEKLEAQAAFRNFNVKVRYATSRKTTQAEITDFEVACTKR